MENNQLEPNQLVVNRGNMLSFGIRKKDGNSFQAGDVVRMKVMEKNNVENVVIQKDFTIETDTEIMPIVLLSSDTKIGELINRPVDYWYEIELYPDTEYTQTLVGYKEEPALFTLRPEGGDKK